MRIRLMLIGLVLLAVAAVPAAPAASLPPDATAPGVSIVGPAGTISAPVSVTVSATDNDAVAHLTVSLTDGAGSRTAFDGARASTTVLLDPAKLTGGFVTLRATATDRAGNAATVSRTWTVEHLTPGTPPPAAPPPKPTLAKARLNLRVRSSHPAVQISRLSLSGAPAGTRVKVLLYRSHLPTRGYSTVAAGGKVPLTTAVRFVHLVPSTRITVTLALAGAKSRTLTIHRRAASPAPAPPSTGSTGGGGIVGGGTG